MYVPSGDTVIQYREYVVAGVRPVTTTVAFLLVPNLAAIPLRTTTLTELGGPELSGSTLQYTAPPPVPAPVPVPAESAKVFTLTKRLSTPADIDIDRIAAAAITVGDALGSGVGFIVGTGVGI